MTFLRHMALVLAGVAAGVSWAGDAVAIRNPFWQIGYEGKREVISAEVREKPKPVEVVQSKPEEDQTAVAAAAAAAAAAAEAERLAAAERAKIITTQHWAEARKALRIGGRVKVRLPDNSLSTSVMINGHAYGDGDFVVFEHDGRRFSWRVTGLTDNGTLKLKRVKAQKLGEETTPQDKGVNK